MDTTAVRVLRALAPFDLQKPYGDEHRCNSPFRPGSNSHAFVLRLDPDGEHGAYHDHVTEESGSLYQLAERLGVPTGQQRQPVEDSKRNYRDLAEYAALKGVPVEAFTLAGWQLEPVIIEGRRAIQFIAKTADSKEQKRWRFLDTIGSPFKSELGFRACWYGLKRAVLIAQKAVLPLILANGEPSVVVGQHFNLPVCALSGGGERSHYPDERIAELKTAWPGEIIVALDCDEKGRKAAAGLVLQLNTAGMKARAVDLGLQDKGDVADFCKLHSADSPQAFQKLLDAPSVKVSPVVMPMTLTDAVRQLTTVRRGLPAEVSLPELIEQIQRELDKERLTSQPGRLVSFRDIADGYHARVLDARANPGAIHGLRSGITKLDELVGGFTPGRIYTILAETGMGKTTLAASIVSQFAECAPGLIVPTEMSILDWLNKLVAFRTGIPTDQIDDGKLTNEQMARVSGVTGQLETRRCDILDEQSPTPGNISAIVRRGIQERGYKWILIDSMSNLKVPGAEGIFERTSTAADLSIELARLGLVVLQTAQVGRNLEGRKPRIPGRHDGKGSGRIEENSDVVLSLYNHGALVAIGEAQYSADFPPGTVLVRCVKHRHRGNVENSARQLKFQGGVGVREDH